MDFKADDLMHIYMGTSSWDSLWVVQQPVMNEIGKRERVLYIEGVKSILSALSFSQHRSSLTRWLAGERKIAERISLYSPPPLLPFWHKSAFINNFNFYLVSIFLNKVLERMEYKYLLLWIDHPFAFPLVDRIPADLVIYHCIDEVAELPGVPKERIVEMEKKLLSYADLTFAAASKLYEEKKKVCRNTYLILNAIDADIFSQNLKDNSPPSELGGIKKPIIGYLGAIRPWLDVELIKFLAATYPHWSFVFVGPIKDVDLKELAPKENIHFLGEKPKEEVPRYLNSFDVCLIPFLKTKLVAHTCPLKLFEYLAVGKPVVSMDISLDIVALSGLIYVAYSHEDFAKNIQKALDEDSNELRKRRLEFAKKSTWQARCDEMLGIIHQTLAEKGS